MPVILFRGQSIVSIVYDKGLDVVRIVLNAFHERLGGLELPGRFMGGLRYYCP